MSFQKLYYNLVQKITTTVHGPPLQVTQRVLKRILILLLVFITIKTGYVTYRLLNIDLSKFEVTEILYERDLGSCLSISACFSGAKSPLNVKYENVCIDFYNNTKHADTKMFDLHMQQGTIEKGETISMEGKLAVSNLMSTYAVSIVRDTGRDRRIYVVIKAKLKPRFCLIRAGFDKVYELAVNVPAAGGPSQVELSLFEMVSSEREEGTTVFRVGLNASIVKLPVMVNLRLVPFVLYLRDPKMRVYVQEVVVEKGRVLSELQFVCVVRKEDLPGGVAYLWQKQAASDFFTISIDRYEESQIANNAYNSFVMNVNSTSNVNGYNNITNENITENVNEPGSLIKSLFRDLEVRIEKPKGSQNSSSFISQLKIDVIEISDEKIKVKFSFLESEFTFLNKNFLLYLPLLDLKVEIEGKLVGNLLASVKKVCNSFDIEVIFTVIDMMSILEMFFYKTTTGLITFNGETNGINNIVDLQGILFDGNGRFEVNGQKMNIDNNNQDVNTVGEGVKIMFSHNITFTGKGFTTNMAVTFNSQEEILDGRRLLTNLNMNLYSSKARFRVSNDSQCCECKKGLVCSREEPCMKYTIRYIHSNKPFIQRVVGRFNICLGVEFTEKMFTQDINSLYRLLTSADSKVSVLKRLAELITDDGFLTISNNDNNYIGNNNYNGGNINTNINNSSISNNTHINLRNIIYMHESTLLHKEDLYPDQPHLQVLLQDITVDGGRVLGTYWFKSPFYNENVNIRHLIAFQAPPQVVISDNEVIGLLLIHSTLFNVGVEGGKITEITSNNSKGNLEFIYANENTVLCMNRIYRHIKHLLEKNFHFILGDYKIHFMFFRDIASYFSSTSIENNIQGEKNSAGDLKTYLKYSQNSKTCFLDLTVCLENVSKSDFRGSFWFDFYTPHVVINAYDSLNKENKNSRTRITVHPFYSRLSEYSENTASTTILKMEVELNMDSIKGDTFSLYSLTSNNERYLMELKIDSYLLYEILGPSSPNPTKPILTFSNIGYTPDTKRCFVTADVLLDFKELIDKIYIFQSLSSIFHLNKPFTGLNLDLVADNFEIAEFNLPPYFNCFLSISKLSCQQIFSYTSPTRLSMIPIKVTLLTETRKDMADTNKPIFQPSALLDCFVRKHESTAFKPFQLSLNHVKDKNILLMLNLPLILIIQSTSKFYLFITDNSEMYFLASLNSLTYTDNQNYFIPITFNITPRSFSFINTMNRILPGERASANTSRSFDAVLYEENKALTRIHVGDPANLSGTNETLVMVARSLYRYFDNYEWLKTALTNFFISPEYFSYNMVDGLRNELVQVYGEIKRRLASILAM